jgi:hypothetical protein
VKTRFLWLAGAAAALLTPGAALAVDHNNVDAHRPLFFDDAESLAFREQALEFGLDAEYIYGFAMNSHASIGFEPSLGGRADDRDTRFDPGSVSLGLFQNFNREYGSVPAFALRGDAYFPTGRGQQGVAFRLRGIASRQAGQYGRFHLNLDLNGSPGARSGDREF